MLSQGAAQLAARLSLGDDAESLSVQLQEAAQELRRDRERLLAIPRFANMADQAPSIEPLSLAMQAASREAARGTSGTSTGLAAAQAVAQAADQFLPAMEAMMRVGRDSGNFLQKVT